MSELGMEMKDLICKVADAEKILYNGEEVIDPKEASSLFEEFLEILTDLIHQYSTLRNEIDILKRLANFDKFNKIAEEMVEEEEKEMGETVKKIVGDMFA